jgi:hypothetical protein
VSTVVFPSTLLVRVFSLSFTGGIILSRGGEGEEAGHCSYPYNPSGRVNSI